MTHSQWAAPLATRSIHTQMGIPGSKSLTNRYLVLAAIAQGASRLRAPLHSRDTHLMRDALVALGASIEEVPGSGEFGPDWQITPGLAQGDVHLDCGLAGTVMRFLPPLAPLVNGIVRFDGDEGARVRPMGPVVEALEALGIAVTSHGSPGYLPFSVHGTGSVTGGEITIDATASSQFVSGLLLAGARYEEGLRVRHTGASIPSQPHIDMTIEALRDVGAVVDSDPQNGTWQVAAGELSGLDIAVEPDLSNASPFLAAVAIAGGEICIPAWPQATTQAGDGIRDILDAMGADVRLDREGLTVSSNGELSGIDVDLHDIGELTPTVAALAMLASSPSQLRGVAHIRGHETDRLAALANEFNALGGNVTETEDGLIIRPQKLHGGTFGTYHDHRMATAGAILGLKVPGVLVENVETTAKTLPEFVQLWKTMLSSSPVVGQ